MKVRDLELGMLVRAVGIWDARVASESSSNTVTLGYRSLNDDTDKSLLMYLGFRRASFFIRNVKKHHLFLLGGEIAIMSGYEVRYLEPVI